MTDGKFDAELIEFICQENNKAPTLMVGKRGSRPAAPCPDIWMRWRRGYAQRPIGYLNPVHVGCSTLSATTKTDAVHYPFTGSVFGLAIAPDGSLLETDAGAGIRNQEDGFSQVAQLPGVTAVSPIGRGDMFAITSRDFGGEGFYRVSRGSTREIADLFAFELRVNPDGNPVAPPPAAGPSNPFDVEALSGGHVLVADAAGNSLLIVDQKATSIGSPRCRMKWCPRPTPRPSSAAQAPMRRSAIYQHRYRHNQWLPAWPSGQMAPTTWASSKGSPRRRANRGSENRFGARHAVCGTSPACRVVADGFTSIVDLEFGPDGTLYVVELDEESWLAMQNGKGTGGSLACNSSGWVCTQIATGKPMLSAVAVGGDGTKFIVTNALIPATGHQRTALDTPSRALMVGMEGISRPSARTSTSSRRSGSCRRRSGSPLHRVLTRSTRTDGPYTCR